ncbi:dihydrolipoamide dehydrogenase [Gammaproteobacteria bacterium 42_54_T18]|nr:dihydrolipoamide dehydrogenase [Gammaproteobacteria bacterium 42_54_T18]
MLVKAFKVSGIVGTLLLLINQYDALFGSAELRVIPAVLTYCVPFVVFIAGQISGKQEDKRG